MDRKPAPDAAAWSWCGGMAYAIDAMERSILFFDTLRERGNRYAAHQHEGAPALLKFAHELLVDGRTLERPCNYALLRVLPPDNAPTSATARPVVVVDPRAGHGPGIGGFKHDSEVGVALRAGHPVYFVTFRPEPEEGQTLFDVMHAEAVFLETVIARHPKANGKPVVIGNCQAGWAISMLASVRPELFGPLMIVGSPLSYWAGSDTMNPMRYSGATLGGSWLAALTADLAGGRFDGAHLVENFERLNPANTLWSRYYKLWSGIDSEAERFLEFERWWGGYFRMTGAEIEAIVENLFVGNKLATGQVMSDAQRIDLRNITAPMVVFASWGDNITPPPQALNWIVDAWGSERAIAAAGRVIVYVLHESVGHLGIFVGADIARKEHDQIVTSLDVIDHLPPGLYEMRVVKKDGENVQRWDDLEPGSYSVSFEHRTVADIQAINPEGRQQEQLFSTVAKCSEINSTLYKTWARPWLSMLPLRFWGQSMMPLHPLRLQRQMYSDANPWTAPVRVWAEQVREHRHPVADDHPGRAWERTLSTSVENSLNLGRDLRDQATAQWARLVYGPLGIGAWLPPDAPAEQVAAARAQADLEVCRRDLLPRIGAGGFAQAVCRVVLAGMVSIGSFERRSFRLARLLSDLRVLDRAHGSAADTPIDWRRLLREEARIAAVAPVEALNALGEMLPDPSSRERALAVAAAVMMIEPTLANPRSEIIELLINTLDVEPDRVMDLACRLTAPLAQPAKAVTAVKPARAVKTVKATPKGKQPPGPHPARRSTRSHARTPARTPPRPPARNAASGRTGPGAKAGNSRAA